MSLRWRITAEEIAGVKLAAQKHTRNSMNGICITNVDDWLRLAYGPPCGITKKAKRGREPCTIRCRFSESAARTRGGRGVLDIWDRLFHLLGKRTGGALDLLADARVAAIAQCQQHYTMAAPRPTGHRKGGACRAPGNAYAKLFLNRSASNAIDC